MALLACSRRAAPTCRSTPPIPRSGWRCARGRGAAVLLTDGGVLARLPAGARPPVVLLGTTRAMAAESADADWPGAWRSAGRPRLRDLHLGLDRQAQGSRGAHGAVVNLRRWHSGRAGPEAGDAALQLAVAGLRHRGLGDLLAPLLAGGRLVRAGARAGATTGARWRGAGRARGAHACCRPLPTPPGACWWRRLARPGLPPAWCSRRRARAAGAGRLARRAAAGPRWSTSTAPPRAR